MIQDIAPKTYHNEYREKEASGSDTVLVYRGREALVKRDDKGEIRFPVFRELGKLCRIVTYLFEISGENYFLGELPGEPPEGWQYENVKIFRVARPKDRAFAGITGHQLFGWYGNHQCCGRCGGKMEQDHKERMLYCSACGNQVYPTISPAVIIGVIHRGKLLMSKYAGRDYKKFALIAGFNEIGETIEETVHREVMEEVGLKVKNLTYYKSQPWSFSGTLLMGFFCELDGEDETITLEEDELTEAGWYLPEEVPEDEEEIALTREMMTVFKEGKVCLKTL